MSWCLWCLCRAPEAMARVESELDGAGLLAGPGRPRPRPLEHADLARLPYLSACLRERCVCVWGGGGGGEGGCRRGPRLPGWGRDAPPPPGET